MGPSSASQSSLATGFGPRSSNDRPIIRSLHRTNSDIFKPLPEPPAASNPSAGDVVETPPPAPLHSFAFPGSSDNKRDTREGFERSHQPHTVSSSRPGYHQPGGSDQGKPAASFGRPHHPYAPFAEDYLPGGKRRGSDASTSSLGITLGASGSLAQGKETQWGGLGTSQSGEPRGDSRPRSQSLSSVQYGNSHPYHQPSASQSQAGSIYKQYTSQNPSLTSLSYYPDATSADGLARSYSQTVLARPDSRASSLTSKRFENQLFSR